MDPFHCICFRQFSLTTADQSSVTYLHIGLQFSKICGVCLHADAARSII